MEQFKEYGSYYKFINQIIKDNSPIITNCYLYQDKIQKLIMQGRFYYEKVDGGVMLYVDEKEYYQAYYYLNVDKELHITCKEKDIVLKNIYMEGKKNIKLLHLEEKIKASGFYLLDKLGQIECDIQTIETKLKSPYRVALKLLEKSGFLITAPDKKLINQIRELQNNIKTIPIYQIPYFTDEEILSMGKEGRIVCIVDERKRLCAIKVYIEENSSYGYVAIKDEYQKVYGMVVILSFYTLDYLKKNNIKLLGWIASSNNDSIKYHMNLGYHWTGRYTDEWILKA